jgi:preprotein translocase subunit SecG
MLLTFLTTIHLLVALVLIFFVLLQDPKGGGAMGIFGGGGGSNTLFGSTGATNFFTQVTKVAAILFAILCIAMTYIISHRTESVLDNTPAATVPVDVPGPDAPAAAPTEAPAPAQPTENK